MKLSQLIEQFVSSSEFQDLLRSMPGNEFESNAWLIADDPSKVTALLADEVYGQIAVAVEKVVRSGIIPEPNIGTIVAFTIALYNEWQYKPILDDADDDDLEPV